MGESVYVIASEASTTPTTVQAMPQRHYHFRPSLVPTLAVVALLPILVSLGFWQLDRAEQKRALTASLEAGKSAAAIDLNRERPDFDAARYRRAVAAGSFDPSHQILVENQVRDGRPGFEVLTPLRLDGRDEAVLVARGWIPADPSGAAAAELGVEDAPRAITGVIDAGPSVGLRIGEPAVTDDWPRRVAYIDYDYLGQALPYPIRPYLVRLDPDAPQGFRRDWRPVEEMGPERHVGYAVQWFALAATLLAIYLVVNLKRTESSDERA